MAALVATPHRYLTPMRSTVTQSGRGGRCANRRAKFTCDKLDDLFGTLHTRKILFVPHARFSGLLVEYRSH